MNHEPWYIDWAYLQPSSPTLVASIYSVTKAAYFKFSAIKYLKSVFKLEENVLLPSPNLFKRKILIKNKRLKPETEKSKAQAAMWSTESGCTVSLWPVDFIWIGQLELLSAGNLNELNEATDEQNAVEGEDTFGKLYFKPKAR